MGKTATLANIGSIADSSLGFRNRIINGAMVIDQRNAGAEVNPAVNGTYYLDRWRAATSAASKFKIGQNAGAVTPPTGFINYLGLTSLSAYTAGASEVFGVIQIIEGLNVADLGWGTASAATVTLSFWVRSSLTGTFGGSLRNNAGNRSYPFTYTISVANTWEQKTVTIAGDTSGTWLTTNGTGINLTFSIGSGSTLSGTADAWASANLTSATGSTSVVGTNGATFYITGVQLEKGSTATTFDYRPYGTELALCQRYFQKSFALGTAPANGLSEYGNAANTTSYATTIPYIYVKYQVQLRATPATVNLYNPRSGGTAGQVTNSASDSSGTSVVNSGEKGFMVQTASQAANNWYVHWDSSAEL
jgi:hypothetical protein